MISDPKIGNKKIGLIPSNERGIHLNASLRNEIIPPAKNPATNAPKILMVYMLIHHFSD